MGIRELSMSTSSTMPSGMWRAQDNKEQKKVESEGSEEEPGTYDF